MSSNAKHLPSIDAGHYKNTAGRETEVMPIPDIVKISMSQHIGAPCQPLVKKGDGELPAGLDERGVGHVLARPAGHEVHAQLGADDHQGVAI